MGEEYTQTIKSTPMYRYIWKRNWDVYYAKYYGGIMGTGEKIYIKDLDGKKFQKEKKRKEKIAS